MSLQINGLHRVFNSAQGRGHVLRGLDLTVEPGEFVAVIGHSGCGKSTLLNLIAGLDQATAGTITLDGELVRGPGPDRAVVFQNFSLLPRQTLIDNVRTAVRESRREWSAAEVDADVERYLRTFGLWEHRHKKPWQVSGGMKQRTAVARAFAVQPRVLLLDEPFGALDALTRSALQDELVSLWSGDSETEIVVMVTHAVDEAVLLADRIVVMGNPPAPSIVEIINVDLPRPRERSRVIDDPAFRHLQDQLMRRLKVQQAA
jgi:nitrate/nitrite transport system ATP-binding protein